MKRLFLIGALLTACGSDGGSAPAQAQAQQAATPEGDWFNTAGSEVFTWSLTPTSYGATQTTSAGVAVEAGLLFIGKDSITFTPRRSSCPGPIAVYTMRYSLANGALVLSDDNGILTLQPVPKTTGSSGGGANAAYGCFDGSGRFFQRPIADVANR